MRIAAHVFDLETTAQIAMAQQTIVAKQNIGATTCERIFPSGGSLSVNAALVQIPIANESVAAPIEVNTPAKVFHIEMVRTSFSKIAYAVTSRSTYAVRIVAPRDDISVEIDGLPPPAPLSGFDI